MNFRLIASDSLEEESGDLRSKEDQEHRHLSERDKLRVLWNSERRCYFDSTAVKRSLLEFNLSFEMPIPSGDVSDGDWHSDKVSALWGKPQIGPLCRGPTITNVRVTASVRVRL